MSAGNPTILLDQVLDPVWGWPFYGDEVPSRRGTANDGNPIYYITVEGIELMLFEQKEWKGGVQDGTDPRRIVVSTRFTGVTITNPMAFLNDNEACRSLPCFGVEPDGAITLNAAFPISPELPVDQARSQLLICAGLIVEQSLPLIQAWYSGGAGRPTAPSGRGMDIYSFTQRAGIQPEYGPVSLLESIFDPYQGWYPSSAFTVERTQANDGNLVFLIRVGNVVLTIYEQTRWADNVHGKNTTAHRVVVMTMFTGVTLTKPLALLHDNNGTHGLPGFGVDEQKAISLYSAFPVGPNLTPESARAQMLTCIGLVSDQAATLIRAWNQPKSGCASSLLVAAGIGALTLLGKALL